MANGSDCFYDVIVEGLLGGVPMKRYFVCGFLGGTILLSSISAKAEDCPSGHYYRMSGRCADAAPGTRYTALLLGQFIMR
jgi:hypothetical protein